jgi:Neprosin
VLTSIFLVLCCNYHDLTFQLVLSVVATDETQQTDAYQETGCYNHYCSGFVQTNNKIAIGAAISPTSYYSGRQFDISILIWKV